MTTSPDNSLDNHETSLHRSRSGVPDLWAELEDLQVKVFLLEERLDEIERLGPCCDRPNASED